MSRKTTLTNKGVCEIPYFILLKTVGSLKPAFFITGVYIQSYRCGNIHLTACVSVHATTRFLRLAINKGLQNNIRSNS